jgi:hypothetical protein
VTGEEGGVTGLVSSYPNLLEERYAMNTNRVIALRQKGEIDDPPTDILRDGARRLIARAVEAEF